MSTTALAAVLAKFASLNVAGNAVAGLAVAAGAVGGVSGASAVADQVTDAPESTQVAVVEHTEATAEVDTEAATDASVDSTDAATDAGAEVAATTGTDDAEVGAGVAGAGAADLPDAAAFGQEVAADAQVDGVVGAEISAQARARAELRRTLDALPEVPASSTTGAEAAAGAGEHVTVGGAVSGNATVGK
ncbi:hypothetical protein [Pengzhenrongella frigida]|uniref:Peptidoglycan-binding protein n=1 Tax=Pengzhenrongella frigida TaxID=1259133 RepID=A0A4Q5N4R9_9MICO|nr:hypothetical protein [Cellulomonas sp. HLT2-17]RYV51687.1 hypothetical protein EUA98_07235 [Cellulomonas sp. HLT2-17]